MRFVNDVFSINKILSDINHPVKLSVVYSTLKTVNFSLNKDAIPAELASNSVYTYTCQQFNTCYIGEPSHHFVTHINEHLRGRPIPSEVSLHTHVPIKTGSKTIRKNGQCKNI